MKRSILVALLVTFLPYSLISAEPSAFGAGNINNPNPYGLTSNEKTLLQNKKDLRKVVVKSNNQANEVDSLRERIDGLQTVIESLSRKSQENKINLKALYKKSDEELNSSNEYEKRLSEFTQLNNQQITTNFQEIEKIKVVITEISSLIDTINSKYVTKDEFNILVADMNKFKELVVKELSNNGSSKKSELDRMSTGSIATKAKSFYNKKYYTKAIEYYTYLISKNYKPARSHYMIGVMKYKRRNYADAISYFKKSASLYSKASYMPSLMLYTGVSMDKTGDKKNAKAFYTGLIKKYPKSPEAISAKKYLNKMK